MPRLIRKFESSCDFCDGKTKMETDQGIVACTTCGAEDPDPVPFFAECDFLRSARRTRSGAFGATEGVLACFENFEELELKKSEGSEEEADEDKLRRKIINSKFLNDEEK